MADDTLLDDLPPNLPPDLRAFLECTGDVATIANGPIEWVEIPANVRGLLGGAARPELQVSPGPTPSSAILQVRAGWVSATLPAAVVDGRLQVDTSKLPMLAPGSIATCSFAITRCRWSSSRPTISVTYGCSRDMSWPFASALSSARSKVSAIASACGSVKLTVAFTLMPAAMSCSAATRPSGSAGTLIAMFCASAASARPCSSMRAELL